MELRTATFNVLADAYIKNGDYSQVNPNVLVAGARTAGVVDTIHALGADVIGLQEVERPLLGALEDADSWQSFWTPTGNDKPDGCLLLVRNGIEVSDFQSHQHSDGSGHVMQSVRIGRAVFANTHIRWAPQNDPGHAGVLQTKELLANIGPQQPAVIFGDFNDEPGGPVRSLVSEAGFENIFDTDETALVNQRAVSLDVLAIRGVMGRRIETEYLPTHIPNELCPSDHIPLLASVEV